MEILDKVDVLIRKKHYQASGFIFGQDWSVTFLCTYSGFGAMVVSRYNEIYFFSYEVKDSGEIYAWRRRAQGDIEEYTLYYDARGDFLYISGDEDSERIILRQGGVLDIGPITFCEGGAVF